MWEILGILALVVIIALCLIAKMFWDRLGKWIQQSAVGDWYKKRPLKWQGTLSIVSIISLLFLFWYLWVYGVTVLLGFVYVSGIVSISVLVSFPLFGFLILGLCWSISERLQREGLDKQIIQIGFPLIAFCILILLLIAIGFAGIVIGTIFTGIVIGTTYSITMLLFISAGKLRIELVELKDQLGRGAITREEYEQKEKLLESEKPIEAMLILSKKLKLTVIFGVVITIVGILIYILGIFGAVVSLSCLFLVGLLVLGYSLFATLDLGLEYPQLYVRVYTAFIAIPSALIFWGGLLLIDLFLFLEEHLWAYVWSIFAIAPLIPLWYVWYRKCRKEEIPLWYPLRYKVHRK